MEENYFKNLKNRFGPTFFVLGVLAIIFILSATLFGLIFLQSVDENLDIQTSSGSEQTR